MKQQYPLSIFQLLHFLNACFLHTLHIALMIKTGKQCTKRIQTAEH